MQTVIEAVARQASAVFSGVLKAASPPHSFLSAPDRSFLQQEYTSASLFLPSAFTLLFSPDKFKRAERRVLQRKGGQTWVMEGTGQVFQVGSEMLTWMESVAL